MVPKLPSVTLGCPVKSAAGVLLSDFFEPLQSYFLSSSSEKNIFTNAESISSCVELMDELRDKAIRPCHDPWASVDFHDKSQIYADLTKAYKNVRLASNVETGVEVSLSPETPYKFAPQRRQPAQKPRIDVGKTSKAAASAKACISELRSSGVGMSGDSSGFKSIMLNVAFLLVLVDVYVFGYAPEKRKSLNGVCVCEKMKK